MTTDDEVEDIGLTESLPPTVQRISAMHLRTVIESLVFASERPVAVADLAKIAQAEPREVRRLLEALREEYASRGVHLEEVGGGWRFVSSASNAPFVRELLKVRPVKLSRAQLETLAIVAYRQPVTRPEIDDIRGVDSGSGLKMLLERNLLRILGRKDEPGRPALYGTTTHFLEFFSLKNLRDLPSLREFVELASETNPTPTTGVGQDNAVPEEEPAPEDQDAAEPIEG